MKKGDRFAGYDKEVEQLVTDFEQTVARGESQFFDVEELEVIIDYYLETYSMEMLQKALEYATHLYPQSISIKLRHAHWLMAQEKYPAAEQLLQNLHLQEPNDTDIAYSLGVVYGAMNQPQRAISYYLQSATDGWQLGRIYTNIGEEYLKMNQPVEAIGYYKLALETDSFDHVTLYGFCEACQLNGQPDEAIQYLLEFIQHNPYNDAAWNCLGNAYCELSLWEKAVDAYEYAIAINPDIANPYEDLAACFEYQGKIGEAASILHRMIDHIGPNSTSYQQIGDLYARAQNPETAILYFKKALEISHDPTLSAEILAQIAVCYIHLDDLPMAISTIKQALAADPDQPDALCAAAIICDIRNQSALADDYYQRLFDTGLYNEQHCRLYTTYLYSYERYDELIDFALDILQQLPNDPFFSTYLVAAYFYRNRYAKVIQNLRSVDHDMLLTICPEIGQNLQLSPFIASLSEK